MKYFFSILLSVIILFSCSKNENKDHDYERHIASSSRRCLPLNVRCENSFDCCSSNCENGFCSRRDGLLIGQSCGISDNACLSKNCYRGVCMPNPPSYLANLNELCLFDGDCYSTRCEKRSYSRNSQRVCKQSSEQKASIGDHCERDAYCISDYCERSSKRCVGSSRFQANRGEFCTRSSQCKSNNCNTRLSFCR